MGEAVGWRVTPAVGPGAQWQSLVLLQVPGDQVTSLCFSGIFPHREGLREITGELKPQTRETFSGSISL